MEDREEHEEVKEREEGGRGGRGGSKSRLASSGKGGRQYCCYSTDLLVLSRLITLFVFLGKKHTKKKKEKLTNIIKPILTI